MTKYNVTFWVSCKNMNPKEGFVRTIYSSENDKITPELLNEFEDMLEERFKEENVNVESVVALYWQKFD